MDKQLLSRLEMALESGDEDTACDLRDDAILYILNKVFGEHREALDEQIYCLHRLQSELYERL